jgi:amino acid transporter
MSGAIRSVRLNYRVPTGEAARPTGRPSACEAPSGGQREARFGREDRRVTIEGIHLAREQSQGFTAFGMLLVYTAAIAIIAFIAGQAFQQFVTDARAYEIERRI